MDGTAGDEPEISNAQLWNVLRATQAAYEKESIQRRAQTTINDLRQENDSLRRRLTSARKKIKALQAKLAKCSPT